MYSLRTQNICNQTGNSLPLTHPHPRERAAHHTVRSSVVSAPRAPLSSVEGRLRDGEQQRDCAGTALRERRAGTGCVLSSRCERVRWLLAWEGTGGHLGPGAAPSRCACVQSLRAARWRPVTPQGCQTSTDSPENTKTRDTAKPESQPVGGRWHLSVIKSH